MFCLRFKKHTFPRFPPKKNNFGGKHFLFLAMDVFDSLGPSAFTAVVQFYKISATCYCHSVCASRRQILQHVSVTLHSEDAKTSRCWRPLPCSSPP